MNLTLSGPIIFLGLLAVGLFARWLARRIYAKNPANCRVIAIGFGVVMLGLLAIFLILLFTYGKSWM